MIRVERLLVVATPALALAAVALGLRIGARDGVRAAVVYGAPMSRAGTGLAWQVVTFEEGSVAGRETVAFPDVEVVARRDGREARWRGATGADGAAEILLALPGADGVSLEVRSGKELLARGGAVVPSAIDRAAAHPVWSQFARREGAIALEVAVLGQRVASGFPATIWVRATDAATHAPLAGVDVEPEADVSLTPAAAKSRTDARGWAQIVATPLGYAVPLLLHARASDGRKGEWDGALWVSPGASQILTPSRWAPDVEPVIDVVVPTVRTTAYLEIDDAQGRAWGGVLAMKPEAGAMPRGSAHVPALAPGLYWAIATDDPAGASVLGPGTIVRPFFVAASDEDALAFGTDRSECAAPRDPREAARVMAVCLALASPSPVPRWTTLDGFAGMWALDAQKRARGLAVAMTAIVLAVLLEVALLVRAGLRARAEMKAASEGGLQATGAARAWGFVVAVLVAVLGFALLGAFLLRVS